MEFTPTVPEHAMRNNLALTKFNFVKYSVAEQRIFKLLMNATEDKPLDTNVLTAKFYGKEDDVPISGRASVIGYLNKLARKIERNKESFRIGRTKRAGPHPLKVWIERC